ncbi:MAG: carnitine 3-dehydrogenase [Pseudomonadota bacterium]
MIARAAILGGGVIGGGWLARLIENGVDCHLYDPDPEAARKVGAVLDNAERALSRLTSHRPAKGAWQMAETVAEAVAGADLVVEAVPERLEIKRAVYAEAEAAASEGALFASSTSGLLPSDLQAEMARPERLIVAHPFNPVYLLPLVEIVPGRQTAPEAVERARSLYAHLGMHPLVLHREIEAFVADRLMEALWREALWLVHDGIATTAEIDDAIRYGCGLRWAQMGTFQTFDIAGGEAGMRHFMAQFAPALAWPWTKLMDTPEMTPALIERIAEQVGAQADGHDFRALERIRDDNLVAILDALKRCNWGAGATLAAHERRLEVERAEPPDLTRPIPTVRRAVPQDWTDYNAHLNESRYAQLFSDAADATMGLIGADAAYVARGLSYFTVECHIRYLEEARAGDSLVVTTQVLAGEGKKMHLYHFLHHSDGRLLATGEQMLLHVNLETRNTCTPEPSVAARLSEIAAAHAKLPWPEGAGRAVGQGR